MLPSTGLCEYALLLYERFHCSAECFVLGLIYVDRIVRRHPDFVVSPWNCHRVLLTSVVLAVKFLEDKHYRNVDYARIGGVSVQRLYTLEVLLLQMLAWSVHVSPEELRTFSALHLGR